MIHQKKNIKIIDNLLNIEKGDNAYYEAQLKYCNFYLKYSGENCDKQKINNIFDNLIKAEYYKASCDYGRFLRDEKKYDEAKIIFKKGSDRSQQFCFGEYSDLIFATTNINQLLGEYNMIYYFLKNICITICLEKLSIGSFFYGMNYLIKHSSFKQKIKIIFLNMQ